MPDIPWGWHKYLSNKINISWKQPISRYRELPHSSPASVIYMQEMHVSYTYSALSFHKPNHLAIQHPDQERTNITNNLYVLLILTARTPFIHPAGALRVTTTLTSKNQLQWPILVFIEIQ